MAAAARSAPNCRASCAGGLTASSSNSRGEDPPGAVRDAARARRADRPPAGAIGEVIRPGKPKGSCSPCRSAIADQRRREARAQCVPASPHARRRRRRTAVSATDAMPRSPLSRAPRHAGAPKSFVSDAAGGRLGPAMTCDRRANGSFPGSTASTVAHRLIRTDRVTLTRTRCAGDVRAPRPARRVAHARPGRGRGDRSPFTSARNRARRPRTCHEWTPTPPHRRPLGATLTRLSPTAASTRALRRPRAFAVRAGRAGHRAVRDHR
jgi:hypothetical protein